MMYVINPKTQRLIQVGLPTYKRLIKEKVITKRTPIYEFKGEKKNVPQDLRNFFEMPF